MEPKATETPVTDRALYTVDRPGEFFGYTVERCEENGADPRRESPAYILTGKRGATYRLIRLRTVHGADPCSLMFARNRFGNVVGIKGNYTFTDGRGRLECYYTGTDYSKPFPVTDTP